MISALTYPNLSETELERLAQELALALAPGDLITLSGDLGAGKTTFARALIRAIADDATLEVPSPTFTLVQTYETQRLSIAHMDLYRLDAGSDVSDLAIDDAQRRGLVIVEWPERAADLAQHATLAIELSDDMSGHREARMVKLQPAPSAIARFTRIDTLRTFLQMHGWGSGTTRLAYMQGDASARRYARLTHTTGERAIVMDQPRQPDGPPIQDGLPYSRIAHLAEDVRPFVAIANHMTAHGLSVPAIKAADLQNGLLIIEDLGARVFGDEVKRGSPQAPMWNAAVDALVALRVVPANVQLPVADRETYALPPLDRRMMTIEVSLLVDWYLPALTGKPTPEATRESFFAAWQPVFDTVLKQPFGWMLRDYHSPNLLMLDSRQSPRDVGIIDFQDAVRGPHAYDLVSLLQDARVDTSADIENAGLQRYIAAVTAIDPGFDAGTFIDAYHILGAERATKILGIFARLAKRDGKRSYLQHIPRMWAYLERNLQSPSLNTVAAWYAEHVPHSARTKPLPL